MTRESAHQHRGAAPHPDGMILMATLVVMLLVTILGIGMLFASRSELNTSNSYRQTLKAFNHADAVVQLAIRATDVMVYGTVEDVRDHLDFNSAHSDYKVEVTNNLDTLNSDLSSNRISTKSRYLGVGRLTSTTPDIIVRDNRDRVVGTVMISHDFANDSAPFGGAAVGSSGGIADKGSTGIGGMSLQYYVITVSGKDPATGGESYFLEDDDVMAFSGPQTFITVLYSVVKSN
jgi:Tfp pilus assembly protein PilX